MADYPNRSDLRNPATRQVAFTGQTYGTATQQAQAQQAVAPGTAPSTVVAQQMAAQQAPTPAPRPGAKPLFGPTERPNEPVTAGANFGAGPNAQQAGILPRQIPVDNTMEQLRLLYQLFPNDDLADMISKYDFRGY